MPPKSKEKPSVSARGSGAAKAKAQAIVIIQEKKERKSKKKTTRRRRAAPREEPSVAAPIMPSISIFQQAAPAPTLGHYFDMASMPPPPPMGQMPGQQVAWNVQASVPTLGEVRETVKDVAGLIKKPTGAVAEAAGQTVGTGLNLVDNLIDLGTDVVQDIMSQPVTPPPVIPEPPKPEVTPPVPTTFEPKPPAPPRPEPPRPKPATPAAPEWKPEAPAPPPPLTQTQTQLIEEFVPPAPKPAPTPVDIQFPEIEAAPKQEPKQLPKPPRTRAEKQLAYDPEEASYQAMLRERSKLMQLSSKRK